MNLFKITVLYVMVSFISFGCKNGDRGKTLSIPNKIIINEITSTRLEHLPSDPDGNPLNDSIELYNGKLYELDISGWKLVNEQGKGYSFPDQTIFSARSYLVISKEVHDMKLGKSGSIYLYTSSGQLVDQVSWETGQAKKYSYCRLPDYTGNFYPCKVGSFGTKNSNIVIEKVLISKNSLKIKVIGEPVELTEMAIAVKGKTIYRFPPYLTISSGDNYILNLTPYLQKDLTSEKGNIALKNSLGHTVDKVKWKKVNTSTLCRTSLSSNILAPCSHASTGAQVD